MAAPPPLFDPRLIALRRARAARLGHGADFLQESAAGSVKERLEEINRDFTDVEIIGPRASLWADILGRGTAIRDDDVLSLEPDSADLVIHALCLHHANDPVGQLIQARRALRPDGLMVACMFAGRSLQELRAAFAEAEAAVTGGLRARVSPMADLRDLGGLVQRAGLALPVADAVDVTVTYESPMHLMRDLRAMGETNVLAQQNRGAMRREVLAAMCDIYAQHFAADGGRIRATFEIVYLTGWAPAQTQQRPLRPGSATTRLADALGTDEKPAGEKAGS